MSLWAWAGRAWAKAGVSAACLALQDQDGQCVPLLLWAVWLAQAGRTPDPAAVRTAILFCRSIDAIKIERLRTTRRAATPPDKALLLERELGAERILMERLETIPLSDARPFAEPTTTLAMISVHWGRPLDADAFRSLVGDCADVR